PSLALGRAHPGVATVRTSTDAPIGPGWDRRPVCGRPHTGLTSRKVGRRDFDRAPHLRAELAEGFKEPRVGHAGADVGPTVRLVLDADEYLALALNQRPARRPLERRQVQHRLLLEALVEK